MKLGVFARITNHCQHIVENISNHLDLGSLMKIVVLIAHSRRSQALIVFFLLLARNNFVQLTDLVLHVLLGRRDGAEFSVNILIHRVQFTVNFRIKYSLTLGLGLDFVLILR